MSNRCDEYWKIYESLCRREKLTSEQLKQQMQAHLNTCPKCSAWWREVQHKYRLVPANTLVQKGASA
jgi:predicted anti-sigma-YlaC factor YlaD